MKIREFFESTVYHRQCRVACRKCLQKFQIEKGGFCNVNNPLLVRLMVLVVLTYWESRAICWFFHLSLEGSYHQEKDFFKKMPSIGSGQFSGSAVLLPIHYDVRNTQVLRLSKQVLYSFFIIAQHLVLPKDCTEKNETGQ